MSHATAVQHVYTCIGPYICIVAAEACDLTYYTMYYTIHTCIYSICSTVACAAHVLDSGARDWGCGLVVELPLMEAEGGEISALNIPFTALFTCIHTFHISLDHRFSMYMQTCTSLPSAVEEPGVSFTSSLLLPSSLSPSSLSPPGAGDGGEG